MKKLDKNWITQNLIDFEYKQYILLAYLNEVEKAFNQIKLYPHFSELMEHYKNIKNLKEQFQQISQNFPKKLLGFNQNKLQLEYESLINETSIIQELHQIIDFSLPKFEYYLKQGKKIYDFIESQAQIFSVGILPLNNDFGYVLLKDATPKIHAYSYETTLFEKADEKYPGIHLKYITSFTKNISNNFEKIKLNLIKKFQKWPNPATYAIEINLNLPFTQTFLPIAQRLLLKNLQSSY